MVTEIIDLKSAKLAKEVGFNVSTKSWYGCDKPSEGAEPNKLMYIPSVIEGLLSPQDGTMIYSAPNLCAMLEWLRDAHKIHVQIEREEYGWTWSLIEYSKGNKCIKQGYIVYENINEAVNAGIYQSLIYLKALKDDKKV